ncbi:large proline-rich protein bag6 isoform X2 [Scaptodrosophila lebanonensis]|uniref:Large proline-rich protein BAG6 n=1 Tax=Drosophila lebanonensis TaxID=7225 RepID=A0A6J2TZ33_DROLE|nr:large proline-rich protein bag6 isoform X2 [Scaptodrosophila lebanonensis]
MLINLKVKTLDARTHEFSIDNEISIRQLKDQIAEKTNIAAENQRIIYQGRVLADEKQLKEFDVDGKVLHVAERPPFSQRGANSRNNDEPRPIRSIGRPPPANMRNSPFFRALDGMLVGTMAIPVNNGPVGANRTPPNRFPNSSSFCINRITVAMHMIDCANNIAAYLEDPEVGLNNQSLDILQRGRWTMESTVVEVGVSATDIPRNNNIIDMVQDAVTAALSRNTAGRNYTVVQLPTVYANDGTEAARTGSEAGAANAGGSNDVAAVGGASDSSEETTAAAVIIEDVIDTDDDAGDVESDRSTPPYPNREEGAVGGTDAAAAPSTSGETANENATDGETPEGNGSNVAVTGIGPRRRTRPQVLANVIDRCRRVQARLAPFVERYYRILLDDPVFEENDTTGREDAQRIFDRVSEAFHYLSHAQHAISDLMLDLSQPGPRVLTCRPILVEQSGYIRSNNIFTPNIITSPLSDIIGQGGANQQGRTAPMQPSSAAADTNIPHIRPHLIDDLDFATRSRPVNPNVAARVAQIIERHSAARPETETGTATTVNNTNNTTDNVEDPVDEPMVGPNPIPAAGAQSQQRPDMDPQAQMARLIQSVVNSAANEADVHVEFHAPNIMSINLPVHVMTAAVHPQGRASTAGATPVGTAGTETADAASNTGTSTAAVGTIGTSSTTASTTGTDGAAAAAVTSNNTNTNNANESGSAASTSSGTRSGEQRANTLPTTATQTRSTARPQIQIGGNNNWPGRIAPTHTAFDRFLPCNSHHIREPEPVGPNNNNIRNAVPNTGTATTTATPTSANAYASAGSAAEGRRTTGAARTQTPVTRLASSGNNSSSSSMTSTTAIPTLAGTSGSHLTPASEADNLRAQLRTFLHQTVFEGAPINDETIPPAISRALAWFGESLLYLPQYERPEYNSHDSVCNILRLTLRLIIELCSGDLSSNSESGVQFEQRLKQICEQFRTRLYSVLFVCVGKSNAELYWRQLMRLLCVPLRSNFRNEALQFLCIYIDPTIPANTDTADAQQFLVLRSTNASAAASVADQEPSPPQSFDVDVEMAEVASSSVAIAVAPNTEPEQLLPQVDVGSEPWHSNFPNDWLPVITRDLQTQTEQPHQQPPYSDAYISGMSAKRRKIIQSEKPGSSVESLIASGVQRAMQSTGVGAPTASSGSLTADAVIAAIAHDATVQGSFTEAVRGNTRERLKKDVDYKPGKYPQINKFTEPK